MHMIECIDNNNTIWNHLYTRLILKTAKFVFKSKSCAYYHPNLLLVKPDALSKLTDCSRWYVCKLADGLDVPDSFNSE